jgi:hypothetical protein
VGNVQGIQRYGRPLRTDPDQGEGFSYHVYPVAQDSARTNRYLEELPSPQPNPNAVTTRAATSAPANAQQAGQGRSDDDPAFVNAEIARLERELKDPNLMPEERRVKEAALAERRRQLSQIGATGQAPPQAQSATYAAPSESSLFQPVWGSPYPPSFDWTDGIRNYFVPLPLPGSAADIVAQGLIYTREKAGATGSDIPHQPLIQVKMRVVEVVRADTLAAGTILEYVSNHNGFPTLTSGQTANIGSQNVRGISQLTLPDLATSAASGQGSLINLTSQHINALVQLLATEAKADVVTAPEVVTLNGQNVEFVAGAKLPFELGQNVIQGDNNNIQQFFYKHVGTMVSVTPRIINWGRYGEGNGERPITAQDILNWPKLVNWMSQHPLNTANYAAAQKSIDTYKNLHPDRDLVPYIAQGELLKALNDFSRQAIQRASQIDLNETLVAEGIMADNNCDQCRAWKPEDCTIDLTVVVRLSDKGSLTFETASTEIKTASTEENVRAISNVIQVKSGHGVAMAGLIGNRETQELAKVPLIGDLPVVGFLFRNRVVVRQKTEVLIFIEARVLDPEPCIARAQSSDDFAYSQPFVAGGLLESPLEEGFFRVGFGTYLPPHTCGEGIYWERFGRDVRKACTHVDDVLR